MRKTVLTFLMVTSLVLTSITPALAVSVITNRFSANDYTISTGQTIYFDANTTYSWSIMPNPYTSSFFTEVNSNHFYKPSTYQSSGLPNPNNWIYKNDWGYVKPSYYYYSGIFSVIPTVTKYLKFTAVAKSAPSGSKYGHRHGQIQNGWDSWGAPAWIYTTHN